MPASNAAQPSISRSPSLWQCSPRRAAKNKSRAFCGFLELFHSRERMNLHDFYGGAWNAQMRVVFKHFRCRFLGFRLHDSIQHNIVSTTGAALRSHSSRFAHAGPLVDEYVSVIAHPFFPIALHFLLGRLSLFGIGLLLFVDNRSRGEICYEKSFHGCEYLLMRV